MLVGCFFVIKPVRRTTCSISFFRVPLSPADVLQMILLQSSDSLLHDVPGSETSNLELA